MAKLNRDNIAGLILLAFSLILAFYLTPDQVESRGNVPAALSPRLFCYITAGLLAVLSLILIIASLRKSGQAAAASQSTSWEPIIRGLICTAIASIYVALASVLGFFCKHRLGHDHFPHLFRRKKMGGYFAVPRCHFGFYLSAFRRSIEGGHAGWHFSLSCSIRMRENLHGKLDGRF